MAELQPIIVFHGRHFVRHLGICVKLLQTMSGVIPRNINKTTTSLSQTVFPRSTNAAYTHRQTDAQTHTHTHDDSIRRNVMRAFRLKIKQIRFFNCVVFICLLVHRWPPAAAGAGSQSPVDTATGGKSPADTATGKSPADYNRTVACCGCGCGCGCRQRGKTRNPKQKAIC